MRFSLPAVLPVRRSLVFHNPEIAFASYMNSGSNRHLQPPTECHFSACCFDGSKMGEVRVNIRPMCYFLPKIRSFFPCQVLQHPWAGSEASGDGLKISAS